jgi:hypothetical protein
MMRQKERCHPFLMGRVLLKAISVFALSTLPLLALKVGLVFFVLLFNHLSLVDAAFFNDEVSSLSFDAGASVVAALLLGGILSNYIIEKGISNKGRPKGTKTRRRHHKTVAAIFDEYGPVYFRRAYRMDETSFWTLLDLIEPKMAGKPKRKRGRAPNGDIANSARLAMAIRYFAGGDPLDICVVFGVTKEAVYRSAWIVVDAIHQTKQLNISFPTKHEEQLKVADEFKLKSKAQFDNCAGCIDGILVWIHKPSKQDILIPN